MEYRGLIQCSQPTISSKNQYFRKTLDLSPEDFLKVSEFERYLNYDEKKASLLSWAISGDPPKMSNPLEIEKLVGDPIERAIYVGNTSAAREILAVYIEDKKSGGKGYHWKNDTFSKIVKKVLNSRGTPREWDLVIMMLEAGADPNFRGYDAQSPFDLFLDARLSPSDFTSISYDDIVNSFLDHGAKYPKWYLRTLYSKSSLDTIEKALNTLTVEELNSAHPFEIGTEGPEGTKEPPLEILKIVLNHGARRVSGSSGVFSNFVVNLALNNAYIEIPEDLEDINVNIKEWEELELMLDYGIDVAAGFKVSESVMDDVFRRPRLSIGILRYALYTYFKKRVPSLYSSAMTTLVENGADLGLIPGHFGSSGPSGSIDREDFKSHLIHLIVTRLELD